MRDRVWIIKYWKEVKDEKCDFEEEIVALNIEEALKVFKEQRNMNIYRIESIIEQIK